MSNHLDRIALVQSKSRIARSEPFSSHWFANLSNAIATVNLWLRRSRSRQRLAELEDHELSDIGVSRAQARFESEKPFWRA